MLSRALSSALAMPAVPSRAVIYKTTLTTTTDESNSTFSSVDIGVPHPRRIIILAIFKGVATTASAWLHSSANVTKFHRAADNGSHEVAIYFLPWAGNSTVETIVVGATSSLRKAVGVYIAYPYDPLPIDSGTATANTTSDATVTNMATAGGGFAIYAGCQQSTLGTFTTTWNGAGAEAVTEDVDAQLESASSYTFGHIDIVQADAQGDVTLAESTSGTKRLAVATWGPPPT